MGDMMKTHIITQRVASGCGAFSTYRKYESLDDKIKKWLKKKVSRSETLLMSVLFGLVMFCFGIVLVVVVETVL